MTKYGQMSGPSSDLIWAAEIGYSSAFRRKERSDVHRPRAEMNPERSEQVGQRDAG